MLTESEVRRSDVIVVGAGPTGLFLAAELALRGVQVTVLERLAEPDPTVKAGSINVATAEILDRRGLLPAAEEIQRGLLDRAAAFAAGGGRADPAVGAVLDGTRRVERRFPVSGHFAGMLFRDDLVDRSDPVLAAHVAVGHAHAVPQHELELLLGEHCARLGVEVVRGVEVCGVQIHSPDDDVVVETSSGARRAGWVVAADGGRSTIRHQLGIEFDGTDPELVGYQAIAEIDDPGDLRRGWTWTPRGVYAYGPIPGRILVARFGPQPADRDAPVTTAELQDVVRDVTSIPVRITGLHGRATRWSDNARQARSYRSGRMLLAGDAAHVHSPFGGQGLNLGVGDAANLGWKLAATVQGRAPAGLLDTYESERHPIAARVLDWTRAQVALMRGDARTAQLRRVVADELLTVPGATNRMVAITSGVTQRYAVTDDPGGARPPVGSIVGDVPLAAGGRLADHAHDGRLVLVDRSPDGRYAAALGPWNSDVVAVSDPDDGTRPESSLLVRPDGVIAWASGDPTADNRRLDAALTRWLGRRDEAGT